MKYLLFAFCLLLGLSACIKTQNEAACPNPPAAPILASSNFTVSQSSNTTIAVINPNAAYNYIWLGPGGAGNTGSTYTFSSNNTVAYGAWEVYAQNGSPLCTGDTTHFTVTLGFTPCTGLDSFLINSTLVCTFPPPNSTSYYEYYDMSYYSSTTGATLDIYFPSQPLTSQVYSATANDQYSLTQGTCFVSYGGGSAVSGASGYVTVTVVNSQIKVGFCNLHLYSNASNSSFFASAYLVGM